MESEFILLHSRAARYLSRRNQVTQRGNDLILLCLALPVSHHSLAFSWPPADAKILVTGSATASAAHSSSNAATILGVSRPACEQLRLNFSLTASASSEPTGPGRSTSRTRPSRNRTLSHRSVEIS